MPPALEEVDGGSGVFTAGLEFPTTKCMYCGNSDSKRKRSDGDRRAQSLQTATSAGIASDCNCLMVSVRHSA